MFEELQSDRTNTAKDTRLHSGSYAGERVSSNKHLELELSKKQVLQKVLQVTVIEEIYLNLQSLRPYGFIFLVAVAGRVINYITAQQIENMFTMVGNISSWQEKKYMRYTKICPIKRRHSRAWPFKAKDWNKCDWLILGGTSANAVQRSVKSRAMEGLDYLWGTVKTALNYSVLGFINDSLVDWSCIIKAGEAEVDGRREGRREREQICGDLSSDVGSWCGGGPGTHPL